MEDAKAVDANVGIMELRNGIISAINKSNLPIGVSVLVLQSVLQEANAKYVEVCNTAAKGE